MGWDMCCPYCGAGQDVCYDDGHGYAEDETHEDQCSECDKLYIFSTAILFHHSPQKADCLNGEPHNYKPTLTIPKKYTRMQCEGCHKKRTCTDDEMLDILEKDND